MSNRLGFWKKGAGLFARSARSADDTVALFAAFDPVAAAVCHGGFDAGETLADRTRLATAVGGRARAASRVGRGGRRWRSDHAAGRDCYAFPDRAAFEAEALSWRVRHDNGTRWLEMDEDELRQREPTLSRRYKFGLLVEENGQCRDPGAYVVALVRHAAASGATLRQVRGRPGLISGLDICGLQAVVTDVVEMSGADNAVTLGGCAFETTRRRRREIAYRRWRRSADITVVIE